MKMMNDKIIKAIRRAARHARPLLLLAVLLACLLTTGCTNELLNDGGNGVYDQGDVGVTLNLRTSDPTVVDVRAVSDDGINHIYVLQYINYELVYFRRFGSSEITNLSVSNVKLKYMNSGNGNVLYVFANTDFMDADPNGSNKMLSNLGNTETPSLSSDRIKTITALKTLNLYTTYVTYTTTVNSFDNYLPMIGDHPGPIGTNKGTRSITVPMQRRVAKINFICKADQSFSFAPTSVVLKNAPSHTAWFPNEKEPAGVGDTPVGFAAYPATFTPDSYTKAVTIPNSGGTLEIPQTYTFYIPENVRGVYSSITDNKNKHFDYIKRIDTNVTDDLFTYIELTGVSGKETATYHIYLGGNAFGDMNLLANYEYNITTILKGIGDYDTRIEYENLFTDLGMDIVIIDKVANCYMLAADLSTPTVYCIPISQVEKGVAAVNAIPAAIAETGALSFDAKSDWSAEVLWQTWKANITNNLIEGNQLVLNRHTDNRYLKVLVPKGVENGNNAVIAIRNKDKDIVWSYHLWFTDYNPDATTADEMNGETHVYAGNAFQTTSGIFYNGGSGNQKRMMDRNLGATWTGASAAASIANVMTTSGVTAATAYKAYGLYYQWGRKDPFPAYDGTATTVNGAKIYDGCGTQIGGNGTFTADSRIQYMTHNETNNLVNAVQRPTVFYRNGSTNDWYTADATRNYLLWQPHGTSTAKLAKTVFDPCPAGWRVPGASSANSATSSTSAIYNPWAGFNGRGAGNVMSTSYNNTGTTATANLIWNDASITNQNIFQYYSGGTTTTTGLYSAASTNATNGRLYIGNSFKVWYPADGERYVNGMFDYVGKEGYSWSASVFYNSNYALGFDNERIHVDAGYYRVSGRAVRCIQDW